MLYWLFTEGRDLAYQFIWPLLCLSLLAPILLSAVLGAGVRRSTAESEFTGWKQLMRIVTYLILLLAVTAVYLILLSDHALAYGRPAESHFIQFIVGGHGIDQM